MGCCGQHLMSRPKPLDAETAKREYAVTGIMPPEEPCVFCAEKHLSLAHEISEREPGYSGIGRQRAIGQLSAAEWHLYKENREICGKVRELRHAIQRREPVADSRWVELLIEINDLANTAANGILTPPAAG